MSGRVGFLGSWCSREGMVLRKVGFLGKWDSWNGGSWVGGLLGKIGFL